MTFDLSALIAANRPPVPVPVATWRGWTVFLALLLHPYLLVQALELSQTQRLEKAAVMSFLLINVAVLVGAAALKVDWRVGRGSSTGWLSVLFAFGAAQNVPFAPLAVAGFPAGHLGYIIGLGQLVAMPPMLAFAWMARRGTVPVWNPLVPPSGWVPPSAACGSGWLPQAGTPPIGWLDQ